MVLLNIKVFPESELVFLFFRCQATRNGKQQIDIKSARFVQLLPAPVRIHAAEIRNNTRAYLEFGRKSTDVIGKYRCEITTIDDEYVTGNLFVYSRRFSIFLFCFIEFFSASNFSNEHEWNSIGSEGESAFRIHRVVDKSVSGRRRGAQLSGDWFSNSEDYLAEK